MNRIVRDVRYTLRGFAKSPGFTALAVVMLGLGIGVNVAIFSAVDAVLFRRLAVQDPDSLVRIFAKNFEGMDFSNSSYPVFTDYRDGATAFAGVAAYDDSEAFHLANGGRPERVTGAIVSGNLFDLLGARPALGRLLSSVDDRPSSIPVAVLSHRLWRARFASDPRTVGSTVQLNGHPFTIVGVASPQFTGVSLDSLPDLWVPMAMVDKALPEFGDEHILTTRKLSWLDIVARLKPGASRALAQAQLDAIAKRRAAGQPKDHQDPMARVLPAGDFAVGPDFRDGARRLSWLLVGMAGLVLLIACADAASLLLLRAERRRRETAVRMALGASRRQVARLPLVESLLLAVMGAVAGILFAAWGADFLSRAVPPEFALPMGAATSVLGTRALGFALAAANIAALLSGLVPALRGGTVDLLTSIKGTAAGGHLSRFPLRDGLVAGQIALTTVLLVGAGLMAHTLAREASVDPGFDPEGKLEATVDLARQGYDRERGSVVFSELLRLASAMPGVRSAALARTTPVQTSGMRTSVVSDGYTAGPNEDPHADLNIVSPGFFRTLGSGILAGRDFDARDTAHSPAVAIVSESMARKFWPGVNPVGRRIQKLGEVIGVARDLRVRSLRRAPDPTVYVPASQFYMPKMTILLEARGDPAALQRPLETLVAGIDPGLPLFHVRTLKEKLGLSLGQGRLLAQLVGAFGALALLLSAAGLYGVVSYVTQLRTREFGIRMALGAQTSDVGGLVLRRGARIAAVGLAVGLLAAAATSRLAAQLLFAVSPLDPLSYGAAAAVLATAVLLASVLPARRASRISPTEALRSE